MEPDVLVFMPKRGDVTLKLIRNVQQEIDSPSSSRSSSFSSDSSSRSGSSSTVGKASTSFEDRNGGVDGNAPPGSEEIDIDENEFFFAPDPPVGDDSPLYPPPPRARRGSDESSRRDRSASPPASFWASLKRQQKEHGLINPIEDPVKNPVKVSVKRSRPKKTITVQQEVHCVVSSRHMMLASEHFEKLLSSETREGRTLKSTGHVTIPMTVDPDTLIILLQIIHGKTREVPRQVSLDLLRKLAIMVNDFGMLASVEFFADTWIDHSKREGLPASYTEDVLSWLFVSFVFGRPEEFKDMANISQRECDEKFVDNAQEIHLPGGIVDAIKQGRQTAINTVISVIHKLITKYMDGTTHCEVGMDDNMRFACDAMLLGSLMKGSHKIGIWPKPEAPFNGQKYNELAKAIRGIKMLDVCGKSAGRKWSSYGGFEGNAHELENFIDNELKAVEENLGSLDLESFSSENVGTWQNFKSYIVPQATPPQSPKVERREATPSQDSVTSPRERIMSPKPVAPQQEISRSIHSSLQQEVLGSRQGSPQPEVLRNTHISSQPEILRNTRMSPQPEAPRHTYVSPQPENPRHAQVSSQPEIQRNSHVSSQPESPIHAHVSQQPENPRRVQVSSQPEVPRNTRVSPQPEIQRQIYVSPQPEMPRHVQILSQSESPRYSYASPQPEGLRSVHASSQQEVPRSTHASPQPESPRHTHVSPQIENSRNTYVPPQPEVLRNTYVAPQPEVKRNTHILPQPDIRRSTNVESELPTRRDSQLNQNSQGIMGRPRGSSGEEDIKHVQREEIRKAQVLRDRPASMIEQPASTAPKEGIRHSYMHQVNKPRQAEDDTGSRTERPIEPVKKGFFAEVKSTVLPEMVQQSPNEERSNPLGKTPSPAASKEKIVYPSIFEPPKTELPKIPSKTPHHQLPKRDPSPPTSHFDYTIRKAHMIATARPEINSQASSETIRSNHTVASTHSLASTHSTASNHTVTSNAPKTTKESITNSINFRQPPKEEPQDMGIGGGATTEEESDIWIPPNTQGYKARKSNKKRFAVNRF